MHDLNEIRKESAPRGRYISAEHIAEEVLRLRSIVQAGVQAVDYEALAESINNTSAPKGDFAIAAEADELHRLYKVLQAALDESGGRLFAVWVRVRLNHLEVVHPKGQDKVAVALVDASVEVAARQWGLM